jgi:hypothetical protein
MLTRVDPAFDGPVILFQDVIEVLHRSVLAVLLQNTLVFELHNRRRVSGMLVGVDESRHGMVLSSQRFGQEWAPNRFPFSSSIQLWKNRAGPLYTPSPADHRTVSTMPS